MAICKHSLLSKIHLAKKRSGKQNWTAQLCSGLADIIWRHHDMKIFFRWLSLPVKRITKKSCHKMSRPSHRNEASCSCLLSKIHLAKKRSGKQNWTGLLCSGLADIIWRHHDMKIFFRWLSLPVKRITKKSCHKMSRPSHRNEASCSWLRIKKIYLINR